MKYKENHYVPRWYQEKFLPSVGERKFYYLDLKPEQFRDPNGVLRTKRTTNGWQRWGTSSCFKETDLYTTKYGQYESTEIERFFFGKVDENGRKAVDLFSRYNSFDDFSGDTSPQEAFNSLLTYMSVQKFRTPKGLKYLSSLIRVSSKNRLLLELQRLQNLHCALWTECVWAIASADGAETKFIVSDHPVTVYNRDIFPEGEYARVHTDPDIRMNGTHTFFALSPTRILILTNLSWARNPYGKTETFRPNPGLFRDAMFNFTAIQTGRQLEDVEVNQINFIMKRRAQRFIASPQEEWLYPERKIPSEHWRKLDDRYLLMPDPRGLHMGGQMIIGYEGGRGEAFDEYGRRPWQKGYRKDTDATEARTLRAFQGEFARLFGPKRRGVSDDFGGRRSDTDDAEYHQYHLDLEKRNLPAGLKSRGNARAI
ncbi:DUF4238 domain-containing protein [Bradyrhizobium sp. CCGUVB4N]|uniref:DUF4238 domain-containing protein n=1 Tax=Bradyrhizobium sp. CCGUVB4N TaxID=2949631 RepID=UPI0020B204FB|nr:DUF4238 domain-containing protein [Bradyrhizobium sp. CCGUVB4N]MCP3386341.1 DUF4238 domain-containing protein [Bradyrhizobium sp. CCGUVB4N]